MFDDFYGFSKTPFSRTIPSSDLYRWESFDELLDRLKYAAKRQLFAVLTGGSGTGKTTALRRFRDELRGSEFSVLYLADSKLTPRTFYNPNSVKF
jgi:type II secretory pathway predicted ATPase ExeA